MNGFLTSVLILLLVIVVGMGVWLLYIKLHRDEEEDLFNNPFVINFMAKQCDGRAYGIETSAITGKDGRTVVKFIPTDIDMNFPEDAKIIETIVGKNKLIPISKLEWSNKKSIHIYLPQSASDFPDALKNTEFGKALGILTETINAVNSELMSVKEGSDRKTEILNRMGDGELSSQHLNIIDGLVKELIKTIAGSAKELKQPASPYLHPQGGQKY